MKTNINEAICALCFTAIIIALLVLFAPDQSRAAITLPVANTMAVTTDSNSNLLAGFTVPASTTISFATGAILQIKNLNLNTSYTVATLPAANTASFSPSVWVTDSTTSLSSATIGTTPSGSGSNRVPVSSNGVAWVIH